MANPEDVLAKKIQQTYTQAAKEVSTKLNNFLIANKQKSAKLLNDVEAGEITMADYQKWMRGQVFTGERWKEKLKDITTVYVNADTKAREIVGGTTKNVFVDLANRTAYDIEKDLQGAVSFELYDKNTVERLLEDNPKMLPEWKIDKPKDYTWNEKRVQNEVTQGIIQGESIVDIGKRLISGLASSNASKMNMFARTAVTGAQNAGRVERMKEAEELGIEVKKQWMATLDDRTRDSHAELDGETVDVDEPFSNGLMYPGDPSGAPEEVYNCRCTLVYIYPKYQQHFERTAYLPDDESGHKRWETVGDMTYKEWMEAKQEGQQEQQEQEEQQTAESSHTVVQGKDISETWQRREDQFDFEIEDVIDAQGFDGKPRVVSAEEFDKAVQESNFIAQRTYSAPDQETLDAYREQLYNGEWYVDCSTGGAQYGQGMYCAADYNGNLTDGIKAEMEHYQELGRQRNDTWTEAEMQKEYDKKRNSLYDELYAYDDWDNHKAHVELRNEIKELDEIVYMQEYAEKFHPELIGKSYTETLTLDPSAKIVLYEDLEQMRLDDVGKFFGEGDKEKAREYDRMDLGAYATLKGYDAINAEGHGKSGSYTVILNRTKVIFKGE